MMNTMTKPSVAIASSTSIPRSRAMEMPARNAPFSMTKSPISSGQRLAPHGEGERAEQKHGDADRHVRAAELRPDGIGERNAHKIGSDRERERDEQSGRDVQHLIDFAPRVDLRRRGLAQQPWDDDGFADQVHERHAVEMPRVVAQAEQRRGCREQQGLQR